MGESYLFMKKLFVLLVLLVTGLGYSQTKGSHNDTLEKWYNKNRLAVEKEFVRLIDSARSNITLEKTVNYRSENGITQKEFKSLIKRERAAGNPCQVYKHKKGNKIDFVSVTKSFSAVNIKYDSILSLASNHHAQFLVEVGESGILSHQEYQNYYGFEYKGNLPILEHPIDRVKYYCPNRTMHGECASMCRIGHIATLEETAALNYWVKNINHVNVKSVAMFFFKGFKNSKPHWNAFMSKGDIDYMGVSFIMDFKNGHVTFVTVMGNDINNKYGDLYVEGLSIDD